MCCSLVLVFYLLKTAHRNCSLVSNTQLSSALWQPSLLSPLTVSNKTFSLKGIETRQFFQSLPCINTVVLCTFLTVFSLYLLHWKLWITKFFRKRPMFSYLQRFCRDSVTVGTWEWKHQPMLGLLSALSVVTDYLGTNAPVSLSSHQYLGAKLFQQS